MVMVVPKIMKAILFVFMLFIIIIKKSNYPERIPSIMDVILRPRETCTYNASWYSGNPV